MTRGVMTSSGVVRAETKTVCRDYVMPSALQGLSLILDLGATAQLSNYRLYRTPEDSDREHLRADWRAIAGDLRNAMAKEPGARV